MKITGIEAIVLVWPPPEKDYWTSLRTRGRVNELIVRVHTDTKIIGAGEAHSSGSPFPGIFKHNEQVNWQAEGPTRIVKEIMEPNLI